MKKFILSMLTIALAAVLLGSCSSKQEVYISNSGSGNISMDVVLDDIVMEYSRDLLGGFSNTSSDQLRIFDIEKIAEIVGSLESVTLVVVSTDSPDRLHVEFNFTDPGKILYNQFPDSIPDPIVFSKKTINGRIRKTLEIYLSRQNFNIAASIVGMDSSDIMDTFGPQEVPYSKEEYMDLMEYLFEEYETPSNIRRIIRESEIIIDLEIDGTVIDYSVCSVSGRNVIIRIPLLDIVTLKKPIEIFLEWE